MKRREFIFSNKFCRVIIERPRPQAVPNKTDVLIMIDRKKG